MRKVSLLTTIYNGEDYIDDMFKSISRQTFKDFEWIIIDDGSTDSTWEKLCCFNDERLKLYKLPENKGVGYANKLALSYANGQYIAKVDVDDISLSTRLEKQIEFLDSNPKIDLVDSFIEYFPNSPKDGNSKRFQQLKNGYQMLINRKRTSEEISEDLYWHCMFINGAMMARRDKIIKVGISPNMKQGEDYLLFYQMNKAGMKFYRIQEKLIKIRVSNSSTTARNQHLINDIELEIKEPDLIRFLRDNTRPLAIWGAGQKGMDTFTFIYNKYAVRPYVFFDSNEQKMSKQIENIPILKPKEVKKYKICIASSYGQEEIIKYLKSQGCKPLVDYYVVF